MLLSVLLRGGVQTEVATWVALLRFRISLGCVCCSRNVNWVTAEGQMLKGGNAYDRYLVWCHICITSIRLGAFT